MVLKLGFRYNELEDELLMIKILLKQEQNLPWFYSIILQII